MTFNEYQKKALSTDITVGKGKGVLSISFMDKVLGLVGESGEFAEKLKKILRDKDAQLNDQDRQALLSELGDVLWYTSVLSHYLGSDIGSVASNNLKKLAKRQSENKLGGKGDNR